MIDIQLIGVQNPPSRKHDHVRVFGYRVNDLKRRVVEVAVSTIDAADLISLITLTRALPIIEVEERYVVRCLNSGDIEMIHVKGGS